MTHLFGLKSNRVYSRNWLILLLLVNLVPRVSHLPAQAREENQGLSSSCPSERGEPGSLLPRLGEKMRDPGNEVDSW